MESTSDKIIDYLSKHGPTRGDLLKELFQQCSPTAKVTLSNLMTHRCIQHEGRDGVQILYGLTDKAHREKCSTCHAPIELWKLNLNQECSDCRPKKSRRASSNPSLCLEFLESLPMCRLLKLPFGLPKEHYQNCLSGKEKSC